MNRIQGILRKATGKPEYNMRLLLNSLSPSSIVPEVDKYYVFVYKAKTKNIKYDKHPFIICTGIYKWGFSGYNVHWNDWRRYTWNEVVTNIYEIKESEIKDMERYPIAKFVSS